MRSITTIIQSHIRWMIRTDMPAVTAIEASSFKYPWSEEDFLRTLRERNCIGMIAEAPPYDPHTDLGKPVGFMVYELWKHKLHILNFAVDPQYRHRSIGTQMMDKLKTKLSSYRRTRITTDIRESNLDGQLFFRGQGLQAIKVMRRYYEDSGEDGYLMQYVPAGCSVIEDTEDEKGDNYDG